MYYKMLKSLIALGRTENIEERIDVLYTAGKITTDQYNDLIERLGNGGEQTNG